MSTMSLDVITIGRPCLSRWGEVKQRLAEWRFRARSRKELTSLNDRILQDIGLSRSTADFEAAKPFWMA